MTLPASPNAISMDQIAAELGKPGQYITLNDADVCALAGKAVGSQIYLPNDFWGKSAMSASASPTTVTSYNSSTTTGNQSTNSTTCTVTGGSGHTYLWEKVSGHASVTILSPTSATTAFNSGTMSPGLRSAVFRCKVTSGSTVVYSNNVTASFQRGV